MAKACTEGQLQHVPSAYYPPPTGGLPGARRIRHISDADLLKARRLDLPELAHVAQHVCRRPEWALVENRK